MKKFRVISLAFPLVIILIAFSQCKSMKSEDQGVKGTITWLEGNQMPTIKSDDQVTGLGVSTKGNPVKRTIKIYPITNLGDAQLENGLFKSIKGEAIAEVLSNEDGQYSLSLPPGKYSVFIVEEEGLFANQFDEKGNIEPLYIKKGEWIQKDIVINYKAYF